MDKFQVLTDIYFGDDSLARLAEIPYKKVFIIADPFVVQGDLIRHILKPLRRGGIEHQLFTDVMPDPPIEAVRYGARDEKAGCCASVLNLFEERFNHKPRIYGGLLEGESRALLDEFFKNLR